MFARIGDVPFFADQVGDDARRPAIRHITGGFGSGKDDRLEFLELFGRESRGTARTSLTCESLKPVAFDFRSPSFDRGERTFGDVHDFFVVEAAQNQLPGLKPFHRLRGNASMCRAHKESYAATRLLVHFFCQGL